MTTRNDHLMAEAYESCNRVLRVLWADVEPAGAFSVGRPIGGKPFVAPPHLVLDWLDMGSPNQGWMRGMLQLSVFANTPAKALGYIDALATGLGLGPGSTRATFGVFDLTVTPDLLVGEGMITTMERGPVPLRDPNPSVVGYALTLLPRWRPGRTSAYTPPTP